MMTFVVSSSVEPPYSPTFPRISLEMGPKWGPQWTHGQCQNPDLYQPYSLNTLLKPTHGIYWSNDFRQTD